MSIQSARDSGFDFVKGALVALMIVYHVMSIMSTAGPGDFRYIRFISGSFIFVSGYILARFVEPGFARDPASASRKLLVRGFKILLIFTVLNLLIHATGVGNVNKLQLGPGGYWAHAGAIYLLGDGRLSSFLILLPIAYLLMAAPAFLKLASYKRPLMPMLMLLVCVVLAAIPAVTARSAVLEFVLVGVIGLCAGLSTGSRKLPSFSGPWRRPLAFVALLASVWITGQTNDNVATYTFGIALVLASLYEVALASDAAAVLSRRMVLLGRYSLASYIGQIVLIQLLFRLFGQIQRPMGLAIVMFCAITAIALVASCLLLDHLRSRSTAVDRAYRLVFT